jgi:hypothetical protein
LSFIAVIIITSLKPKESLIKNIKVWDVILPKK